MCKSHPSPPHRFELDQDQQGSKETSLRSAHVAWSEDLPLKTEGQGSRGLTWLLWEGASVLLVLQSHGTAGF